MNILNAPLGSILNCSVHTLDEYMRRMKIDGYEKYLNSKKVRGETNDYLEFQFDKFLRTISIFEDPLIPNELLLIINLLRNNAVINKDSTVYDTSVNMQKVLALSSIIIFNYNESYKNHCLCIGKRFNLTNRKDLKDMSSIDVYDLNTLEEKIVNKYELILCNYFPKIKKSLFIRPVKHLSNIVKYDIVFEFNHELLNLVEENSSVSFNGLYRLQNIELWEKLLRIIGPIQMTILFVSCSIFKRLNDKIDGFIQQSGRMITNDYLEELSLLLNTEVGDKKSKNGNNNTHDYRSNELKISNLFRMDIPFHSNVLYCDHFSRKGGLPCTSVLRLLPPSKIGSRTLLRFVFNSEYLFKEHDKNSLLSILGSYNMNKYSRVRCKFASKFLTQFEKLLINIRRVNFVYILSKLCPLNTINDLNLKNINKTSLSLFETSKSDILKYLRLILNMTLPKNILGSSNNLKLFINKKIPVLINLHLKENYKIKHIMSGMKISNWVSCIMSEHELGFTKQHNFYHNIKHTNSRRKKSFITLCRGYIARNIYFIVVHLVNPILRRHFYITDTEGNGKIRYFRYPIWIKIVRQAEKSYLNCILKDVNFNNKSDDDDSDHEYSENIIQNIDNIPKIRWLPKSKGIRPLLNLSKPGSGKIIYNKYVNDHECFNIKTNRKCLCNFNLTCPLNVNPYTQLNSSQVNSNLLSGTSGSYNIKIKPSSSKIVDLKRPSTNNLLFNLSKILRSFLLRDTGRKFIGFSDTNYLGTSLVRYGDAYKYIRNWWLYVVKKTIFQRIREYIKCNLEKRKSHSLNKYPLNRIFVIKADMVNCYENIEKKIILELIDKIELPEKIPILTLYNRVLRKSTLTPPFDKLFKDYYIDEKNKLNIVMSKGKLITIPIFNYFDTSKNDNNIEHNCDLLNNSILSELERISSHRSEMSILGYKKANLFTSLNSKKVILWRDAKKLLKLHLNNNYIRIRTSDKEFKKNRINKLKNFECKNNIRVNKKIYSNIIKQKNGIPQGSVVSCILCCLYYGFLDADSNIKKLLTNSGSFNSSNNKNYANSPIKNYCSVSTKKRKIDQTTEERNVVFLNNENINTNGNTTYGEQGINNVFDNHLMNGKNLLLRWVDDFLFLTLDLDSAKMFLDFLYIKKLWGDNITYDKINTNFKWYVDDNNDIKVIDDDEDNDIEKEKIVNNCYSEKVSWSGMTFSSNLFNMNLSVIPWKNVEFTSIMDTITLTVNDHYSNYNTNQKLYKFNLLGNNFGKSNYMWSILGIKVHSYFDLRIKNGLLFDSNLNSMDTIYSNIVLIVYIGILKLLYTMKRIKKIHEGFINSNFITKVIEWISKGCNHNIYMYKKKLDNNYLWKLLIKCAIYDSILTCIKPRYKFFGLNYIYNKYNRKYIHCLNTLNTKHNYFPAKSSIIIKENLHGLPKIYRTNKKNSQNKKE